MRNWNAVFGEVLSSFGPEAPDFELLLAANLIEDYHGTIFVNLLKEAPNPIGIEPEA